jgi:hypothetical protein
LPAVPQDQVHGSHESNGGCRGESAKKQNEGPTTNSTTCTALNNPSEHGVDKPTSDTLGEHSDAAQDFGSLIEKEVADLKDKKQHAFRFHDTGIRTLVFLEMPFATKDAGPCQVW